MMIHISLGGVGSIHVEAARAYGRSPAWHISHFGREIVLDVPFVRVIVTPATCERTASAKPFFCGRVGQTEGDGDETEWPVSCDRASAVPAEDRP